MQHLAFIMDGNRRFAAQHNVTKATSYQKGKEAARRAIEFCLKSNIKYLSLYTFSLENFSRPSQEQALVFSLLTDVITHELSEFIQKGVRIRFIGDRERFPEHLQEAIVRAETKTAGLCALHLNILFCYGGKQELLSAVKKIATQVKEGTLAPEEIDEETLSDALWTAGVPHPDLIVRTSGVSRLSNFLLYQAAYSELAFLDCHWPEVTIEHLQQCVDNYHQAKRSYGA